MEASGEVKHVVSGHDADTLNRFTKVTDGELAGLVATIGANGGAGTEGQSDGKIRRLGGRGDGAGGGLGRASAERLAAEGASVVVIDVNGDTAEQVAAAIGNKSIAVQADISSESDVQRYIDAALSAFGRIDHHHLNAGIFGTFALLPDISVEDFQRVMDVNVRGQFLGLRAAFRQYARRVAPVRSC